MDAFAVELLARQMDLTWLRIAGADHSFNLAKPGPSDGLQAIIGRSVAWFLGAHTDTSDQVWPLP
jgi:hypothetical protein